MALTLIKNGTVITMNSARDIVKADILIDGAIIRKIGKIRVPSGSRVRVIDAQGCIVAPGFVQTHIHLCQTLFRNLADDLELLDWLKLKIWPFEAAHNPASIRLSAEMGLTELIRGGTTTIMDMGTVHHTDHIFEAIDRSGIRALCGKAMMDDCPGAPKGLIETRAWSVEESLHLMRYWHRRSDGRLRFAFAPRFVLSCSEELLCEVRDLSEEYGLLVHTHASENRGELAEVIKKCGTPNVEYFHDIRLTGERLCLAHCIHLNETERHILRDTGTKVMHCPSSNLKLGSGIAHVPELLGLGVTVSLGADGAPCNNNLDMFQEMRLAALLQKPRLGPRSITAEEVYTMATLGGAKTLDLSDEIGSLETGKRADLIIMQLDEIHSRPEENLYSQIVYSAKSTDVRTVVVDGKVLMKDRRMVTLDDESVRHRIGPELKKLLNRIA